MKIVISPDSFKDSLSSVEVASCIEIGFKKYTSLKCSIVKVPLADGGNGTIAALVYAGKARPKKCRVTGPLKEKILAEYAILTNDKVALVEMAKASGIEMVPLSHRNPWITTTYGTGELIKSALDDGFRKIIVGIGGSATVDGGIGMAQALGIKFFDCSGKLIKNYAGGSELSKIRKIDINNVDKRIYKTEILVATDVKNVLLGKYGAAYVYGPQKGASTDMVRKLDLGLTNIANVIQKDLGINISNMPGAGAAGGLGGGLVTFLGGKICSGVELMMDILQLDKVTQKANLVITGEGRIDKQTIYGKTVAGVIKTAYRYKVPVVCIGGSVVLKEKDKKFFYKHGVIGIFDIITCPIELSIALKKARELLIDCAENISHWLKYKTQAMNALDNKENTLYLKICK